MAEIKVTSSVLRNKMSELQNLNSQYKSALQELRTVENTLASMWEGEARSTFHNAFAQDVNQMGTFYNAVAKYVETLLNTAAKYQEAEMRNVEIGKTRSY